MNNNSALGLLRLSRIVRRVFHSKCQNQNKLTGSFFWGTHIFRCCVSAWKWSTQALVEAEDPHEREEVEPKCDQSLSAQAFDQELLLPVVPAVGPDSSESQTDQQQLPGHDSDFESPKKNSR